MTDRYSYEGTRKQKIPSSEQSRRTYIDHTHRPPSYGGEPSSKLERFRAEGTKTVLPPEAPKNDEAILKRLKMMDDLPKGSERSLFDGIYREIGQKIRNDMRDNPDRDFDKQQELVNFRSLVNGLRQNSGIHFHATENGVDRPPLKDYNKDHVIGLYKEANKKVTSDYRNNDEIQSFWMRLHDNRNVFDEEYRWSEDNRDRPGVYLQYKYDEYIKVFCPLRSDGRLSLGKTLEQINKYDASMHYDKFTHMREESAKRSGDWEIIYRVEV